MPSLQPSLRLSSPLFPLTSPSLHPLFTSLPPLPLSSPSLPFLNLSHFLSLVRYTFLFPSYLVHICLSSSCSHFPPSTFFLVSLLLFRSSSTLSSIHPLFPPSRFPLQASLSYVHLFLKTNCVTQERREMKLMVCHDIFMRLAVHYAMLRFVK